MGVRQRLARVDDGASANASQFRFHWEKRPSSALTGVLKYVSFNGDVIIISQLHEKLLIEKLSFSYGRAHWQI